MAKKTESKETAPEIAHTTSGGVAVAGNVTVGEDNKLSAKEQGQKARGELDENGNPTTTNKVAEAEKAASASASAKAVESGLTEKEKAVDAALEERIKVLKAAGEYPSGRVVEVDEPLYRGKISAEAVASATGQKVSVVWDQAEATTEDGLFHSFVAYHPSAKRDTFKIDPQNKIDPTLRTYLEK